MLSKILDCPSCQHRFNFEYEGMMPQEIVCPGCGKRSMQGDYSALAVCRNCHTKLRIPLSMIYDKDNVCPQCNTALDPGELFEASNMDEKLDSLAGGPAAETPQQLQPGEFFDKYKIIRMLGRGGMAEVYLAEHLLLHRHCALKLMRSNMATGDFVFIKRFLQEAKLLNSIEHENIVKVYDVGSDFKSGTLFIAMEYVEGQTLLDILRDHKFSSDELQNVLIKMGHALQALDDAKVVHRDIKPSNIMMTKDGVLKLMDLGIAKFSGAREEGEMTLTMEQSTIGTPNYASPEQCRSAHHVDIRSDIYCLGATLYHLASGRLPFDGDTPVATILEVMQKEPEPLKSYRPDLPEKMLDLIAQMMQKDPDERPESPDQLLAYVFSQKNQISGNFLQKTIKRSRKFLRRQLIPEDRSAKGYTLNALRLATIIGLLIVIVVLLGGMNSNYRRWQAQERADALAAGKSSAEAERAGSLGEYVKKMLSGRFNSVSSSDNANDSVPVVNSVDTENIVELEGNPKYFYRQFAGRTEDGKLPVISGDFLQDKLRCTFYDFAQELPVFTKIDRAAVIDGVLCLDGSKYQPGKSAAEQLKFLLAGKNTIPLTDFNMVKATLSLDFMLEESADGDIISLFGTTGSRSLRMAVDENKQLYLVLGGKYLLKSNMKIPVGKFINITFTMNKDESLFAVYSGNQLAGAWFLPESFFNQDRQILRFGGLQNNLAGRIARLQAWNYAITPDEEAEARFAPPVLSDTRPEPVAADNGSAAGFIPWSSENDGAAWDNDGTKLNEELALGGKPFIVLLTDAMDLKSYQLNNYLAENKIIRESIEKHFTPIAISCNSRSNGVLLEQIQRDKLILDKIGQLPSAYPAWAVFDRNGEWINTAVCAETEMIYDQIESLNKYIEQWQAPANTIDMRLQKSRIKLEKLKRQAPGALRDEQLKFAVEQIKILEEQKKLRASGQSRIFSAAATDNFRRQLVDYVHKFNEYWKLRNDDPHADENWAAELKKPLRNLMQLLESGQVDPDLQLVTGKLDKELEKILGKGDEEIYLIDLVFKLPRCSGLRELARSMLNNGVDVNNCTATMPVEFYYAGREDIPLSAVEYHIGRPMPFDKMEYEDRPVTFAEFCRNPLELSGDFRKILLLAPELDGTLPFRYKKSENITLMQIAARRNDPEMGQMLLTAGFSSAGERQSTPWRDALLHGSSRFVEFCKNNNLQTADLESDHVQYNFCLSVQKRDHAGVKKYLAAGADPFRKWYNNMDALENACLINDVKTAGIIFDNPGFAARARLPESYGYGRVLFIAIQSGAGEMLDYLLGQGVKPHTQFTAEALSFIDFINNRYNATIDDQYINLLSLVAVFSAFTADNSKGVLKVMEVLRARNMLGDSKHNESLLHMAVNGNYKHPEVQKNLVKYLLRIGAAPTRVNSGMVRDPELGRLIDAAKRRNLIKKR